MKKNLAVMISGQGSNLEIFLQNKQKFSSIFVVSSKADAFGLKRAKNHQVDTFVLDKKIDWTKLNQELQERNIDMIFLAGFMRIVPASFVEAWRERLFNLHPSMLPKYRGLKAIEQAVEAKDDVGVSIHHVVPEVDAGEVILQKVAVPATELSDLSLQQITEKTHQVEHHLVQAWIDQFTKE